MPRKQTYDWNYLRPMNAMIAAQQKLIEQAFRELSEKYRLPRPLLYSHNFILQCLRYQEKPMSPAEISRSTGQALPNVSVAIRELKANGLILCTPDPNDRRRYTVTLSDLGQAFGDDYIQDYLSNINKKLYAGITPEMVETVRRYFDQVEVNIQRIRHELAEK